MQLAFCMLDILHLQQYSRIHSLADDDWAYGANLLKISLDYFFFASNPSQIGFLFQYSSRFPR